MLTIMFTRAAASSADTLMISAVLDEDNDEAIYHPAARVFQYEHKNQPGEQWFVSDFSLSVQDIAVIEYPEISPDRPRFFALLGAEGDVAYLSRPDRHQERIEGAGTSNPGSRFYGQVLTLKQIGRRLYVIGIGGQIYVREGRDDWRMLTDAVLFNPEAENNRKHASRQTITRHASNRHAPRPGPTDAAVRTIIYSPAPLRRRDGPSSSMRCAAAVSRSRTASAMAASAI